MKMIGTFLCCYLQRSFVLVVGVLVSVNEGYLAFTNVTNASETMSN